MAATVSEVIWLCSLSSSLGVASSRPTHCFVTISNYIHTSKVWNIEANYGILKQEENPNQSPLTGLRLQSGASGIISTGIEKSRSPSIFQSSPFLVILLFFLPFLSSTSPSLLSDGHGACLVPPRFLFIHRFQLPDNSHWYEPIKEAWCFDLIV
ncbi:hypothetical protein CRG98_012595 [Punica granatum]|uniref:Uncharacterized protein n=1 Tax=Punica granatum TaxID=22663 RepID=A0A2I0KEY1_PUNGR|nr:hypothetical protein CRG98_012595 [Punica granatum]